MIMDEDSEGRDSYDYELYEEQQYSQHQSEVERNIRLKNEMEEIVAEKKNETQGQTEFLDEQLNKDFYKGQNDPCGIISNQDLEERICIRGEDEMKFDILLSGTSATLVIQTQKKVHVGWIGDSMATVLGLGRDKQANGSSFITYPPHVPSQP